MLILNGLCPVMNFIQRWALRVIIALLLGKARKPNYREWGFPVIIIKIIIIEGHMTMIDNWSHAQSIWDESQRFGHDLVVAMYHISTSSSHSFDTPLWSIQCTWNMDILSQDLMLCLWDYCSRKQENHNRSIGSNALTVTDFLHGN